MNDINQFNSFFDYIQFAYLTSNAQLLYIILLDVNNKCNWLDTFGRTNQSLMGLANINEKTLIFSGIGEGTELVTEPLINASENMKVSIIRSR